MSGYIGVQPVPQATQTRDTFTATAGQTSFATSGYTPGYLDVFLNGVHLVNGTDYTATNGSDVVLTTGATAGDNLEVVAYTTFQTGDFVPTSGGTFAGNVAVTGNLTVDTNTLFVDAANNRVGVGTSSPADKLTVNGGLAVTGAYAATSNGGAVITTFGSNVGAIFSLDPSVAWKNLDIGSALTTFSIGGSERMRLDASGNLLVGTTTTSGAGVITYPSLENGGLVQIRKSSSVASGERFANFIVNTSQVGSISYNGSGTNYNTSSDYRLKENVVPLVGAADRLAQIPVHRFNFISDPDTTVDGFLAHEAQEVVPEAVTGQKDETEIVEIKDEDGNVTGTEERPVYQGIDQSKIVPLLTAALQEALTKIEQLEARMAILEGGAA